MAEVENNNKKKTISKWNTEIPPTIKIIATMYIV